MNITHFILNTSKSSISGDKVITHEVTTRKLFNLFSMQKILLIPIIHHANQCAVAVLQCIATSRQEQLQSFVYCQLIIQMSSDRNREVSMRFLNLQSPESCAKLQLAPIKRIKSVP